MTSVVLGLCARCFCSRHCTLLLNNSMKLEDAVDERTKRFSPRRIPYLMPLMVILFLDVLWKKWWWKDGQLESFLLLIVLLGALVVMTTFVCWTPYSIVKVKLCDSTDTSQQIWIICRFLSYSNSAINPLIYSIFNRGLHTALVRGYIQFFKRIKSCCHAWEWAWFLLTYTAIPTGGEWWD